MKKNGIYIAATFEIIGGLLSWGIYSRISKEKNASINFLTI